MSQQSTLRHLDIIQPRPIKIAVCGVGGVGAVSALILAKMGFSSIDIYDMDTVEEVNIGSQLYSYSDIGRPKVEALADRIKDMAGVEVVPHHGELVDGVECDVLLMAVDSMDTRKMLAERSQFDFAIDSRMGGETFNLYAFFDFERERWAKTWFPASEAREIPCTARAVSFNTFAIGGLVGELVKRYNNGEDVPFETNFCFKTRIWA